MTKIHFANQSQQKLGGGFTFLRTIEKYWRRAGGEVADQLADADTMLISGATMVQREVAEEFKAKGGKIVLRVDNIPRNSRNRNTGTSRLYDFAQLADLVVYQSLWAAQFISPFIKRDGPIILNGADTDYYKIDGEVRPKDGHPQHLYVQYNRDETKQWHVAWYNYKLAQRKYPNAHLWIVGNFSPEQIEYNFDFFQGERYEYLGVIDEPERMAEIYRNTTTLHLPDFNDACLNTLIEYLNCQPNWLGVEHNGTGGTQEILEAKRDTLTAEYMTKRYMEEISNI